MNSRLTELISKARGREIGSTLVQEMVHAWQETYGKAPRRAYHNRVGDEDEGNRITRSTTGTLGGKETGQSILHYIVQAHWPGC